MIVRIATEGQYRLDDSKKDALNELDNAAVAAVDSGDEAKFREALDALLNYVRNEGSELDDEELEESDLILPPGDLTLEEAGEEFSGEGLIPG
ncbi:MAG: hypothetical protein LC713_04335 [Actinobacteria bacterium]|nr:hypothetical protein [Actinomycetota bacterium]